MFFFIIRSRGLLPEHVPLWDEEVLLCQGMDMIAILESERCSEIDRVLKSVQRGLPPLKKEAVG